MSTAVDLETSKDLPTWVNRQYIEDAIRLHTKDNTIRITKFKIVPVTENLERSNVMYRIPLEYVSEKDDKYQKSSYILKVCLKKDIKEDSVSAVYASYNFFEDEMTFYDSIFPKLKDILQTIGCNENLVSDAIKIDYKCRCIILEDLNIRNYILPEKKSGLTFEQAKMVLKKVAKIHAASVLLNEKCPGIFKNFDRGFFNKHTDKLGPFFTSQLELCGQVVRSWKGFECYGEKLLKLKSKFMEFGRQILEPKERHLNVLIHGALSLDNIMYKFNDENQPIDAILLHFQASCWSSPTNDLNYFFHTSLAEDVICKYDELIQFYYIELSSTLQLLNYGGKVPTLKEFFVQYMENRFYAVFATCIILPFIHNEKTEDAPPSLEKGERSKKFREQVFSNEKIQKVLKSMLPIFDRRGLLDII